MTCKNMTPKKATEVYKEVGAENAFGNTKLLEAMKEDGSTCKKCDGSGYCSYCDATGNCHKCEGTGKTI